MRWLAIILLSVATVCGQTTDDEIRKISPGDIVLTLHHMRTLITETQDALAKALASEERMRIKLESATEALVDSQSQLLKVDQDIHSLQAQTEEQTRIAVGAKVDAVKAQRLADHRGNLLGWLGAGLLCMLCLKLTSILPAPYGFLLPVAAIPAGYWLARLLL
jgi:hypothetical protein